MAATKDALKLLGGLPRVSLSNIKSSQPKKATRQLKKFRGLGTRGQGKYGNLPRIGFEGGQTPFYLRIPKEPYYKNHSERKEYVPLSLLQLQRLIDLGRVDTSRPIDLAALCNTSIVRVSRDLNHYGVHLTDEGADSFKARVCLEVQRVDETAIAVLERAGSIVSTRYFDPRCVQALIDPKKFFSSGKPIPTCKSPTNDLLEYYVSAKNRGYLASIAEIEASRIELAQKYGYILPKPTDSMLCIMEQRKSPFQIFYGLEPGWVVNLADLCILKPTDSNLQKYFTTETML